MRRTINKCLQLFGYELQRSSRYRADPFALQREMLEIDQAVIVDVGAHVGSVARTYRQLFPSAVIHCFEPFPDSFSKLQRCASGDSRMICHPLAVSDRGGIAKLHANASSATNSLLPTDDRGSLYWGAGLLDTTAECEVRTTTIDDFVREQGLRHIDILKLDVQGAEFRVLSGAKQVLAQQQVSLIYTELILCPTYRGQKPFGEYLNLLEPLGYQFLDFFNPVRRRQQLIQADIIFVSNEFKMRREANSVPYAKTRRKAS